MKIDYDGGKLFVEQYQGTDSTARKIDGAGDDTPLNQAIIKAVQDALVNNLRDNTTPSAAIVDSPNIAGPLQASRGQIEIALWRLWRQLVSPSLGKIRYKTLLIYPVGYIV